MLHKHERSRFGSFIVTLIFCAIGIKVFPSPVSRAAEGCNDLHPPSPNTHTLFTPFTFRLLPAFLLFLSAAVFSLPALPLPLCYSSFTSIFCLPPNLFIFILSILSEMVYIRFYIYSIFMALYTPSQKERERGWQVHYTQIYCMHAIIYDPVRVCTICI